MSRLTRGGKSGPGGSPVRAEPHSAMAGHRENEHAPRRAILAVLQPDGTAWGGKEATMWERSQVERLTGLSRHMIQDLCYHNAKGGGLGFWEPAVSKPGYSRFDEGDLLMFYLVGQLKRAGFTLKEVEAAVFSIMEDTDSLDETLYKKAHELRERQKAIAGQLAALGCLEGAVQVRPTERLYAVMDLSLTRSITQAISAVAAVRPVDEVQVQRVRDVIVAVALAMTGRLRGTGAPDQTKELFRARGIDVDSSLDIVAHRVGWLVLEDVAPTDRKARGLVRAIAAALAVVSAANGDRRARHQELFVLEVLARLLGDAGCGVPVELVFGNGSFAFLAQAFRACATSSSDSQQKE